MELEDLDPDGRRVGVVVRAGSGFRVGRWVGRLVRWTVAAAEGSSVGTAGALEGRRVKVGSSLGVVVGSSVGCKVLGDKEMVGADV